MNGPQKLFASRALISSNLKTCQTEISRYAQTMYFHIVHSTHAITITLHIRALVLKLLGINEIEDLRVQ